ncbi:uncharacterized protein N7500_008426 [Penicillium coprophilum]|uniref:uncharacterized protein n=1 Tax=Penicillium coprophilum TaxID=36646 RepID=UPI002392C363|nr:uncharacterized protein N7500_008426 [Penicillium coprophilum]KAJ5158775.1 hypothetical protein N7500_008426 [Penicillium coprophilum]
MQRDEEQRIQQMAPTVYEEAVKRNEEIQARKRHEEGRIRALVVAREPTYVHGNTASVRNNPFTPRKGPKYYPQSGSRHGSGGDGGYSGGGSSSNDSGGGGYSGGGTGDSGSSGDSGGCGDGGGGCGD